MDEWVYMGKKVWLYGIKVRGIVRQAKAKIEWSKIYKEWGWEIYDAPDYDAWECTKKRRVDCNFEAILRNCEEVMGIKDE